MLSNNQRTINHLWSQPLHTADALKERVLAHMERTKDETAAPDLALEHTEELAATCLLLLDGFDTLPEDRQRWVQVACLHLCSTELPDTPPDPGVLRLVIRCLGLPITPDQLQR